MSRDDSEHKVREWLLEALARHTAERPDVRVLGSVMPVVVTVTAEGESSVRRDPTNAQHYTPGSTG